MSRLFMRYTTLLVLIALVSITAFPQREVSIPITNQKVFVTDFKAPYEQIYVDIDQNNFIETESLALPLSTTTQVVNRKDKPVDRRVIRPGVLLEISGERFADRIAVSKVKLLTDVEKWDVEVKGYFEGLEGDKAWVDGQAVRLAPGAVIRGDGPWHGKTFSSFNDMQLGSELKLEGVRKADGLVYAAKGEARPNEFSGGDRKMLTMVRADMLIPEKLEGGKGKVGGREVTFVNDLELQKYVNKIGNRLVPQYERDLPNDFPGKILFRFFVIEDESFNAFALPDGSVFVHTGLLRQIKNEAQLASVLGHEIAHVTHEHSRKKFEGNSNRQWLQLAAILGGKMLGSKEATIGGLIAVQALQNHYGRAEEDQADRVGLYYMTHAGYDPREGPKVWREIAKNTKQDAVSNFLYSDHSMARTRLKNLNREIAYNYYDADFGKTNVGRDGYLNVVGVHFGWNPKPTFANLGQTTTTASNPLQGQNSLGTVSNTGKKPTAPAPNTFTNPSAPSGSNTIRPTVAFSEAAASKASWVPFWLKFVKAVDSRSKTAVMALMSSEQEFYSGNGGESRDGWLRMLDATRSWSEVWRSLTKSVNVREHKGHPGRITKDDHLVFAYIDGRWCFVGVGR